LSIDSISARNDRHDYDFMYHLRRFIIAILVIVSSYFALSALHRHLDPNTRKSDEEREDARWIATSKNWLDRQACRWVGICGLAHWHPDPAAKSWKHKQRSRKEQEPLISTGEDDETFAEYVGWEDTNGGGRKMRPEDWDGDPTVLKDVPQFVLDHAPLIHLYSGEQFWPSDIAEHLMHTEPHQNNTSLNLNNSQHSVHNLHMVNGRGRWLFMKSKDDVEQRPDWLGSAYNKPIPYPEEEDEEEVDTYTEFSPSEKPKSDNKDHWYDPYSPNHRSSTPLSSSFRTQKPTRRSQRRSEYLGKPLLPAMPTPGGYSPAPAILILVDKGNGILDAFWFYFYSYNLGTTVLNIRFGNHIGDWEHSLIRFHHGVPKAVFFSAHSGGLAYSYDAVEKGKGPGREGRPVLFSARGSHAMYATPGNHPYILPFGLLADVTDRGPMWDPAQNYLAYHYNTSVTHHADAKSFGVPTIQQVKDTLQPAAQNPKAPIGWWWYAGHWGDKFYELGDFRQWRFVGQYHYVNGPFGPRFKNLGRSKVCQSRGSCMIQSTLKGDGKRSWLGKRSVKMGEYGVDDKHKP
jgi:hypothetical protein